MLVVQDIFTATVASCRAALQTMDKLSIATLAFGWQALACPLLIGHGWVHTSLQALPSLWKAISITCSGNAWVMP